MSSPPASLLSVAPPQLTSRHPQFNLPQPHQRSYQSLFAYFSDSLSTTILINTAINVSVLAPLNYLADQILLILQSHHLQQRCSLMVNHITLVHLLHINLTNILLHNVKPSRNLSEIPQRVTDRHHFHHSKNRRKH